MKFQLETKNLSYLQKKYLYGVCFIYQSNLSSISSSFTILFMLVYYLIHIYTLNLIFMYKLKMAQKISTLTNVENTPNTW